MKCLALFATLSLTISACQLQSTEDVLQMEAKKIIGFDITVRRSLSDIWINTEAFCPSKTDVNCAEQLDELQHELNDLNPVPIPQSGLELPITASAATNLYREFVNEHAGEPILAVFQQLYPRILLNKYGVLQSKNYELIAYFTQQLAESNALDFDTRTDALIELKDHIPADRYELLLNRTVWSATQEAARQRNEINRLKKLILAQPKDFTPTDPTTYPVATYKRILKQYEKSTLPANIARLNGLQDVDS